MTLDKDLRYPLCNGRLWLTLPFSFLLISNFHVLSLPCQKDNNIIFNLSVLSHKFDQSVQTKQTSCIIMPIYVLFTPESSSVLEFTLSSQRRNAMTPVTLKTSSSNRFLLLHSFDNSELCHILRSLFVQFFFVFPGISELSFLLITKSYIFFAT